MAQVLHLPDHGRLLVCTDLQGNLRDFDRIADLFRAAMVEADGDAHLLFTGDSIDGPHIDEVDWPDFLGEFYRDESPAVMEGFVTLRQRFPDHVHAILGNHEHAHVGGPHTAKFAPDEVVKLEGTLGAARSRWLRGVLSDLPICAVSPCGIVFTHGAPAAEIKGERDILAAPLDGHNLGSVMDIFEVPVIGKILWARSAHPEVARRFLAALGGRVSVFGHDVVPEGYERIGDEQMIVSTSFGVPDANKFYLDLDLGSRYETVHELREGTEILPIPTTS